MQICSRIGEPVDMVQPQPADTAFRDQLADKTMAMIEDGRSLHADGSELADIEEPAIVDPRGGAAPARGAIALAFEQPIQALDARRVAGLRSIARGGPARYLCRPRLGCGELREPCLEIARKLNDGR